MMDNGDMDAPLDSDRTGLPDCSTPDIAAIVLAAGSGTRFDPSGTRHKLLERLPDGRPIIRATCETMLAVLDSLTVVCHHRTDEIKEALSGLDVRILHCEDAPLGMGASIRCGIRSRPSAKGWLIMLGDLPYVQAETVSRVRGALNNGALIARPFFKGTPGHPVGFGSALTSTLSNCDPDVGLKRVIAQHKQQVLRIDVDDAGCMRDVDRPADIG